MNNKKVLITCSVIEFLPFELNNIKLLKAEGFHVSIATNVHNNKEMYQKIKSNVDVIYNIPFSRQPFSQNNIKAFNALKKIMKQERFDLVHCHTPVVGFMTRLIKGIFNIPSKILYTAHGFHFYTGAPIPNWLIYFSAEWLTSFWTDTLITINTEDYERAKKYLHAKSVEYIPGVGVDTQKFKVQPSEDEKKVVKKNLGVAQEKIFVSIGELNTNKNHEFVIKALSQWEPSFDYKYFIIGRGNQEHLKAIISSYHMENKVLLLGFRSDIKEILSVTDYYIHPSFREGLSVSIMEALASGVPCLVSDIRGNRDLVDNSIGALFDESDPADFLNKFNELIHRDRFEQKKVIIENAKQFDKEIVNKKMQIIYNLVKTDD